LHEGGEINGVVRMGEGIAAEQGAAREGPGSVTAAAY
jgi:hypothetical protein